MKSIRRLCLCLALLMTLALCPAYSAYAAGVSVSAPGNVTVGDTVRVSVSFSGANIMGVNASFSYDSSVLSFAGGSSSVSNGKIVLYASEGKSSLSVSFNFTAIAAGTSRISVSIDECLDADMNSLGGGSGSASVTVSAPGAAATAAPQNNDPKRTPGPTPKPTPTPVPVNEAEIEAAYGEETVYVWHAIPEKLEKPEGYEVSETAFKGETIEVLSREEHGLTLAYVTDAKGENGQLLLLRGETLLPYVTLEGKSSALTLLPLPEKDLPMGFTPAEIALSEDLTLNGLKSDADETLCLFYGWGADGKEGWYLYDSALGSLTRYQQMIVEKTVEVMVTPKPTPTSKPTAAPTPEPTEEPAAEPEPEASKPSSALPWTLFGVVAAALAGSWCYFKKDALVGLLAPLKPKAEETAGIDSATLIEGQSCLSLPEEKDGQLKENNKKRILWICIAIVVIVVIIVIAVVLHLRNNTVHDNEKKDAPSVTATAEITSSPVADITSVPTHKPEVTQVASTPIPSSTENENLQEDEEWEKLESIGAIESKDGILYATITLPVELVGEDITQENLDAKAGETYVSATLNEDGSVTFVMTKAQHKAMLKSIADPIEKRLVELVDSPDYAITKITHNKDYSSFDVYLSTEELGMNETLEAIELYAYGGMYSAFTGQQTKSIVVSYYSSDGKLISTGNSSGIGE